MAVVARKFNLNLSYYRGWIHRFIVDPYALAQPYRHQDIDHENPDKSAVPLTPYMASSGMASAAATAPFITGEPPSLA